MLPTAINADASSPLVFTTVMRILPVPSARHSGHCGDHAHQTRAPLDAQTSRRATFLTQTGHLCSYLLDARHIELAPFWSPKVWYKAGPSLIVPASKQRVVHQPRLALPIEGLPSMSQTLPGR